MRFLEKSFVPYTTTTTTTTAATVTPAFLDGFLPALQQALYTHLGKHPLQQASVCFFLFDVLMLENIFLQNFIWLHESATKPLQRAAPHIKGTGPHVDPVAAMQNVHKPMNCYSTIMFMWPH